MWGQLVGVSGVLDLVLPMSRVGRLAKKADVVFNRPYISGVHCTMELRDGSTVWLMDLSTNGVYVNGNVVGRNNAVQIVENDEISFTKPGVKSPGVEPAIFTFHFATGHEPRTPTHRPTPKRPRSPYSTPEPQHAVINSAKKLCVSSTTQRDELISGTEAMQKANQELRQRLVDQGKRENELKERIQTMLVAINDKQSEFEKLSDEHTKLKGHVLQQDHRVQDLVAEVDAFKAQEEVWKTKEAEWAAQKDVHAATAAELATAQRQAQNAQSINKILEDQVNDSTVKITQTTQQVRDLEIENHQLKMQLDALQMKRDQVDEDTRRGVQEQVLVMKARFATAREAFHQMQKAMALLGEQIQVPGVSQDTRNAEEDDEDDGETQCMDVKPKPASLPEASVTAEKSEDEEERDDENFDAEDGTKPFTYPVARSDSDVDGSNEKEEEDEAHPEPKFLSPDETHVMDITTDSPREAAAPPVFVEPKKRWLQLNTMDDSHNDSETGLFDETQISQDMNDE
ncbi:hypothetical protein ACHHYP_20197 [Achlya hypogyna]|uniref:FHA domain-containing protein n=1 Tax=Achlya hypogyna TaxID=1202772 RepID=A0A1V9YZF1_ACHHY|nr:hypothetical protein ACHHYP_20197 [Achlya hypogyna]